MHTYLGRWNKMTVWSHLMAHLSWDPFKLFWQCFGAHGLETVGKHQRAKNDGWDLTSVSLPCETCLVHRDFIPGTWALWPAPDPPLTLSSSFPTTLGHFMERKCENGHFTKSRDVFYHAKWDPPSQSSRLVGWVPEPASLEAGTHRWLTPPMWTNSNIAVSAIPHKLFRNNSQREKTKKKRVPNRICELQKFLIIDKLKNFTISFSITTRKMWEM